MEIFASYVSVIIVIVVLVTFFRSVDKAIDLFEKFLWSFRKPEPNRKRKNSKTEYNEYIENVAKEFKMFKEAANVFGLNINKYPDSHLISSKDYLKSKYREKVKKVHPDHGGNKEAFIRVKKAYDILLLRAN